MITQYEVPAMVREEIPPLSAVPHLCRQSMEVFASMHDLTDCARHSVEEHNFTLARKCFMLAEKLYRHGDRVVRMLVENIFVYGFSTILPNDKKEVELVRAAIPPTLYNLYLKQIMSSGC
ncbi:MAG: DUF7674 family protein [Agriterribacter sp.]